MNDAAAPATQPTTARAADPAPPLLRAEGLQRRYQMGRSVVSVLRGCNLNLERGAFVAIMGKSGSGKSTLLHVLGALDVPDEGQVYFEGEPIYAPQPARRSVSHVVDVLSPHERRRIRLRRRAFGFVFQMYHLLPELDVLNNVLLTEMVGASIWGWLARRGQARPRAIAMLQRVGLGDRLRHRPAELSGGERQRVAIARAIVHQPPLLLADEPTGNLDAQAGRNIMEILSGLHRDGQTIVMVTHDEAIAARADRVLRLEGGALVDG